MIDMSSPFVLFEGLDLAGKSSAAHAFAAQAPGGPWRIQEKSLVGSNPIRSTAVALKKNERLTDGTMGWLHYASFLADVDLFEEPETPTVQESLTIFRSIAYHSVVGDPELAQAFTRQLDRVDVFSEAFALTASIEARQERLAQRIKENPRLVSPLDMLVQEEPTKFMEMEKRLLDALHTSLSSVVVVDTVEFSREGVVDFAIQRTTSPTLFDPATIAGPQQLDLWPDQAAGTNNIATG